MKPAIPDSSDQQQLMGRQQRLRIAEPRTALILTSACLCISALLIVSVGSGLVDVAGNTRFLPWLTFLGLLPASAAGLVNAIVSFSRFEDTRSQIAIVLGAVGTPAAFLAYLVVVVTAAANQPV